LAILKVMPRESSFLSGAIRFLIVAAAQGIIGGIAAVALPLVLVSLSAGGTTLDQAPDPPD
jgi:hypothetical protein